MAGYSKENQINTEYGFQSIINLYDNELYLPSEFNNPQDIYIRHVECDEKGNVKKDSNGNPILLNISNNKEIQIYKDNNAEKEKTVSNNPSKIGNTGNNNAKIYQEYYSIPLSDKLKATRSLTFAENGNIYRYMGYKYSTADTLSNAESNLSKSSNSDTQEVVTIDNTSSNSKTVTVIEFKYYVQKPDTTTTPDSGIETLNSKDEDKNCQMSYTPTNADIKPYLIASKFKLKDLKYDVSNSGNGVVSYSTNTFKVDKLVLGSIENNPEEGDIGRIFGGENDKETLLIGSGQEKFSVNADSVNKSLDEFRKKYTNDIPTQSVLDSLITGTSNKTSKDDFEKKYRVPENRYNGLRRPKLGAIYQTYDIKSSNWINNSYVDYASNTCNILVYNPIKVEKPTVKSEGVVDHSTTDTNTSVIQKNANFELTLKEVSGTVYGNHTYSEYLSRYYLIFDFDIVKNDNTEYSRLYTVDGDNLKEIYVSSGDTIPQGTLIEINKDAKTFKAKAGANSETGDNVAQDVSKITLIGVSNNMPSDKLIYDVLSTQKLNTLGVITENYYISSGDNTQYVINGSKEDVEINYCEYDKDKYKERKAHKDEHYGTAMYGDAYYFAKAQSTITNIGRIYDFKVTDCSDVDYKAVFRKSDTGTVNDLTKIQYFSGIKEFKLYSKEVNELNNRSNISLSGNTSSKTILPLGPYKNTNSSYINAPKMGYRISFDLKTSGYYKYDEKNISDRNIVIIPSYYYISKDGKTYDDSIDLYYKDSNGKYVKFIGSNYTIYFKPNDGYRNILNSTTTNNTEVMSDKLEPLTIGSKDGFKLYYKMMSTSDNYFIQAWYGEFKLPNSTIAVKNGNISKPLTDGYIGVKFDITCVDKDSNSTSGEKKISYNSNNKNADPNVNTTQWDYEGYVGFNDPGHESGDISIQLEKGTWVVNDNNNTKRTSSATYNNIKGTVVLFDTDNRAANDFD